MRTFTQQSDQARRDADEKIARQRDALVEQLQQIQDRETKAGHLDEALAVRERIRQLKSDAGARLTSYGRLLNTYSNTVTTSGGLMTNPPVVSYMPRNVATTRSGLMGLRGRVGDTFDVTVTGSTSGTVWGTGVYTDDSDVGTAAVHAGVLQPGQTATLRIRIDPGPGAGPGHDRARRREPGLWGMGGKLRVRGACHCWREALASGAASVSSDPCRFSCAAAPVGQIGRGVTLSRGREPARWPPRR